MKKSALLFTLLLLLASGCATLPQQELDDARLALARASAADAPETANTEYLAAKAALDKAENLIQQGEYQAARELLPFVTAQARQAAEQAVLTKQERERQRQPQTQATTVQQTRMDEHPKQPQIPRPVQQPTVAAAPPKQEIITNYRVTTEESLWDIACRESIYADGLLWPLLYKANRDQIKDPRKIYPGQTLTIPRQLTSQDLDTARREAKESGIFAPPQAPKHQN